MQLRFLYLELYIYTFKYKIKKNSLTNNQTIKCKYNEIKKI